MYKTTAYHTLDETLIQRWHTLWDDSKEGHFYNTPEWFLATCDVYGIKNVTIITIEKNGELLLILPLVTKKIFGVPALSSPGGKFVNKSSLLIYEKDPLVLKELVEFLQKQGNFYLQEVSSEIADSIVHNNNQVIKKEASINPYLHISPDPFFQLSAKNKSQIRGILRKNKNEISFNHFAGDRDALEVVFELDNRSSKKQQGKATFVTQEEKDFFRELVKKMSDNVSIDFMYYKDIPVVYSIGFTYKNIFHACLTAFDARYHFLRPGKLLTYFILNRLQDKHFDLIDFGRGNSMLKQEFTKNMALQYTVFSIRSLFARQWLIVGQTIYNSILNSKLLYSTYLFFKKRLLYR